MNLLRFFEVVRHWIAVISITLVASSFWALILIIVLNESSIITDQEVLINIWCAVGMLFTIFLLPRVRKYLVATKAISDK